VSVATAVVVRYIVVDVCVIEGVCDEFDGRR